MACPANYVSTIYETTSGSVDVATYYAGTCGNGQKYPVENTHTRLLFLKNRLRRNSVKDFASLTKKIIHMYTDSTIRKFCTATVPPY